MFYELRKQFVFPEIDAEWRKNQVQQIEEIKKCGRVLELAVDRQCDSAGHSARYNTISPTQYLQLMPKQINVSISGLFT